MKGRLEPAALSSAISLKARQLAYWWVSWPLAAQILSIYGISRLWGWLIFSSVGLHQTYGPWKNGPMAYGEFVMIWDADWYEKIASGGYPSQLPLDSQGQVAQNEWAFYPLYPLLVGALSRISGLDYSLLAPLVSLIFGAGASYWIYRLGLLTFSRQAAGLDGPAEAKGAGAPTEPSRNPAHSKALWFLALVNTLAVFPIVHTGYAEACGLFFLTWTLCYLLEGRYLPLLFPALAASLSRPLGVPLGATLGLYWFFCWYQAASTSSWLAAFNNKLPQLLSALAACCFAFIHPALAWLATGRLDAYTATEAAWRAGGEEVLPFLPWWTQSQHYLGPFLGPSLLILLLAGLLLFLLSTASRRALHPALLIWILSYLLYLLAFFNPQSSTFRLLLPLFPLLLPLLLLSASRAYLLTLALAGASLQWSWVGWLWHWKQLPGGGDYPP